MYNQSFFMRIALQALALAGSTLALPQASNAVDNSRAMSHAECPGMYLDQPPWKPASLTTTATTTTTIQANHGFLPRDGGAKNGLSVDDMVYAMQEGLNFDPAIARAAWGAGLVVNPNNTADRWDLKQLRAHNTLEHDASLSRADDYWTGNGWAFDQATFDETKSYWTDPILNKTTLARAKIARQVKSKFTNPEYLFNMQAETFSLGEILSLVAWGGDKETFTVRRDFLVYWFENERFPTELGWTRPTEVFTGQDQNDMEHIIAVESSLRTDFEGL